MRWIALVVLAVVGAACSGAAAIPDTDCADPATAEAQVRVASVVIKGVVTEWDGTTAQFVIEEIWRGPDMPDEVEIVPEAGRAYTPGERYLVFPTEYPSPLADTPCSATARWEDSFSELRPATARVPGVAPAEDADLPWEWVLAAATVAVLFLGARLLLDRRGHPEPEWNPDFQLPRKDETP